MTISFQQLRSAIPGAQPQQLDPGQVAFNVSDGTMYLGTGTDSKIDFSGEQVLPAPPAGKGWLQVLLERNALNDFFIANPVAEGRPAPQNEQVLTWNSTEGVAEWQDAGTGFAYLTDTANVAASIGATTSEKISAAIGNPGYIGINASCIVTGDPGSTYEGLYIWSGTQWRFASHFAFNTASQVPGTNPMNMLQTSVQAILNALKGVDDNLQSQITSNDGDIATLQTEMTQAQTDISDLQANKLDKAANIPNIGQILSYDGIGQLWIDNSPGDVTTVSGSAPIVVDNTDPQNPVVTLPSTAAGQILVGNGSGSYGPLSIGTDGYILSVVDGSPEWVPDAPGDVTSVTGTAPITVDNTNPETPVVGVNLATTATPGVVQVELTGNMTLVDGVIDVPSGSTTVAGVVQLNNTLSSTSTTQALTAAAGYALQQQIDALVVSPSTSLAGGWDAANGVVAGVTADGAAAGFVNGDPLPAPAPGNEDYYLICVVSGTDPSPMENGDWLLSDGTSWQVLAVGPRPAPASYTQAGVVQLADAAAVLAGTSDTLAITPQALQSNIIDSVTTVNSSQMASATAVNTAYVAAEAASTAAAAAQATANAALPLAGGTLTGTLAAQNVNVQSTYSLQFAGGVNGSLNAVTDDVNVTSSTTAASATAVKAAADAAAAAQTTANAAIPSATFTAANQLLVGSGAGTYAPLTVGTNGQVLTVSGGNITWAAASASLTGYTNTATPFNTALGGNAGDSITTGINNTSLGYNAGTAITGGNNNTFVGFGAGDGTTTSDNNTALGANALGAGGVNNNTGLGYNAGAALTTGSSNTFVGASAGDNATTADFAVAVGFNALGGTLTGANNVAVGSNAGAAVTSGTNNTFVGNSSGDLLTNGNFNAAFGSGALGAQTGGDNNTALGSGAGDSLTTGGNNVLVGRSAGSGATTATGITAVGYLAAGSGALTPSGTTAIGQRALQVATGTANTAVGNLAGSAVTTGANNTLVGTSAGAAITTGTTNTCVGSGAGDSITTASSNTLIGYNAGQTSTGIADCVAIGYSAMGNSTSINNPMVAVGVYALNSVTSGVANVAVGYNAGALLTTGGNNTALGHQALDSAVGGANNTAVGANALTAVTSGDGNIAVGNTAGDAITTGSNNTILGDIAGSTTLTGNVIIAAGSTVKFQANGSGAWSPDGVNYGTAGQILASGGTGAVPAWTSALPQVTAPTASTDPGVQGQMASDATHFYLYTGGRWQRINWDNSTW